MGPCSAAQDLLDIAAYICSKTNFGKKMWGDGMTIHECLIAISKHTENWRYRAENAERERDAARDLGFYGRMSARLSMKLKESESRNATLSKQLKETRDRAEKAEAEILQLRNLVNAAKHARDYWIIDNAWSGFNKLLDKMEKGVEG